MILMWSVFFILLCLNMPIAFVLAVSGLLFFMNSPMLAEYLAVQKVVSGISTYSLLCIPFFIFAGNLMNEAGITKRLLSFASVLVGHLKGGLAQTSLVLTALLGGMSGSVIADAAMESRILGPTMIKKGYGRGFTAASIGFAAMVDATIPPSVGLILYGVVGEVSIGKLFVAGIVPGLMIMFILMIPMYHIAKKRNYPRERDTHATFSEVIRSLGENVWAIIFPFLLIIGIRCGLFTPTESGVFAIVYAIIVGTVIYRELTIKALWEAVQRSIMDSGSVMMLIAFSYMIGYAITYDRLPQTVGEWLVSVTQEKFFLLFMIIMISLIMGMFMEATVNIVLLTPIFMPVIQEMGIDPVYFGIIFVIVLTLGSSTPPVGTVIFTTTSILNCSTEEYVKESIPFLIAILVVIALLVLFPPLTTFIPNLVYGTY